MKLIALKILFIVPNHIDETVINLGKGTQIKDKHKDLPVWLVASVEGVKEPCLGSVADVAQRQNDGNDKMLPEKVDSEKVTRFQIAQRAAWINGNQHFQIEMQVMHVLMSLSRSALNIHFAWS